MSKPRITIFAGVYQDVRFATSFCWVELSHHPCVDVKLFRGKQGLRLDVARNDHIRDMLKMPKEAWTDMLLIDADVKLPYWGLDALIECNADIAAAPIPVKSSGALTSNVLKDGRHLNIIGDGPVDVDRAGAGCMLVKREALETIGTSNGWWFEYRGHFSDDPEYMECDKYFTKLAKDCNLSVRTHARALCGHYHEFNYLDLMNVQYPKPVSVKEVEVSNGQ